MKLYAWEELDLSFEGCPGSAFAWAESEEAAVDLICAKYAQMYEGVTSEAVRDLREQLEGDGVEITEPYGYLVVCG